MPKISRFSHFLPWGQGYYLAFHAGTGALGLLTEENYKTYNTLAQKLEQGGTDGLSGAELELLGQLRHGQFVVESDSQEFDLLKFRHRDTRFDLSALGLVIAPTMACNMACGYCYEANKTGRMTPRLVEGLIAFIEKRAPGLKSLQVSWYGGEPLLALDIMEDLTEAIFDLEREHGFKYDCGGVISNGYLLDREAVRRLVQMRAGHVQVTLDGPARSHNQKRPLKNGKDSFNTIVENIAQACEKISVGIRVNIDKSYNRGVVEELLDELESAGLKNRVGVYFGLLEPATAVCANISENCYETKAFSLTEIEYYKLLLDRGFFIQKLPQPIVTFCLAQIKQSFLIDPEGEMYRCFNYSGDKAKSMGNIAQEVNYAHPEFTRLFSFDPFEEEACRSCDVLPICMGGCPSRRVDRDTPKENICESWKFNLRPMLELIALSRQQENQLRAKQAAQETSK
jgi:uncharacterized protein